MGLSQSQIHDLAKKGLKVQKTSRRDLAYVMTKKLDGSTTVSATMVLAAKAGIAVFVTGGMQHAHAVMHAKRFVVLFVTEGMQHGCAVAHMQHGYTPVSIHAWLQC